MLKTSYKEHNKSMKTKSQARINTGNFTFESQLLETSG